MIENWIDITIHLTREERECLEVLLKDAIKEEYYYSNIFGKESVDVDVEQAKRNYKIAWGILTKLRKSTNDITIQLKGEERKYLTFLLQENLNQLGGIICVTSPEKLLDSFKKEYDTGYNILISVGRRRFEG